MCRSTMCLALILGAPFLWTDAIAQDEVNVENHYLVYHLEEVQSITGPIVLRDQFGDSQHTFALMEKFANPVDKNGEGIFDPIFHRTWWIIDDPQVPRTIVVNNQFGTQTWTIGNGRYLVLPATKNSFPPTPPQDVLNHYKCYDALGPQLDLSVSLVDQFLVTGASPVIPHLLCNPVEKEFAGQVTKIVDPDTHLACYSMEFQTAFVPFMAADQFGEWQLTSTRAEFFCVPSLKEFPVQTHGPSWGELKSIYR